ncbi:MAG TPA: enoyl-CoA hydratase/isomerase family protein [Acetobacteraceae bacterium]|jgi:enoyl-CoA hydratase|nr:enoyl-CoA hydratase/isomerase family protein [Acetobacteraceae bacterium]
MFDLSVVDQISTVTMNRPPVNAMSSAWVREFHALLDRLEDRDDWVVLHIRSALKVFSAGADLKEMRARFARPDGIDATVQAIRDYQQLFARIEALPRVTLAEIAGGAVGGGFELALACDLRIAADDARVGLPEVAIGLLPGAGGTQRMTRLAGFPTALRLILGAEVVNGTEAASLGLAQWTCPRTELAATATAIARRYAALPAHAIAAAKACIAKAAPRAQDGFTAEVDQSRGLLHSPVTVRLIERFLDRGQS